MNQEQFIIRTQSDWANLYSVGEKVAERIYLFRAGDTNLSLEEAKALLARKVTPRKQG